MEKMEIYERYRAVPQEAKKPITAGRMKGKTDINPMWRIKALTETFGPCGIGWFYEVTAERLEQAGNETAAFVDLELYVKTEDGWSKPIHGTGGNKFVSAEKSGTYMSDECFKMATTDALSVACKQLGIGADVYWSEDRTKYTEPPEQPATEAQVSTIKTLCKEHNVNYSKLLEMRGVKEPLTGSQAGALLQYIKRNLEAKNGSKSADR